MGKISENISKIRTAVKEGQWAFFLPALVVFYSFIKEAKVSDPFVYKYQTELRNFTEATLNGEVGSESLYTNIYINYFQIYPYFAYACLIGTLLALLSADILLYKPIMFLEVIGHIIYRFTLLFMDSVLSQQIGHAFWGIAMASDVGCDGYIYAKFEKHQYKT